MVRRYSSKSKPHYEADPKAIEKIKKEKTIIYPRGLTITWGNDDRYWRLPSPNNKSPNAAAELLQVSWLEVTCSTDNVEIGKKYKVGFNVSMRPDAFGWKGREIYIMAKFGKMGKFIYKKVCLEMESKTNSSNNNKFNIPKEDDDLVIISSSLSSDSDDHKLYFGIYEVWSEMWKGGFRIHHAFVHKLPN